MRRRDTLYMAGLCGTVLLTASIAAAQPPPPHAPVSAALAINQAGFVSFNGLEQWVTIRGADRSNPILLVVGGTAVDGPGAVMSPYVGPFQPFEARFTVVQWDPRGAGKTFVRNGGLVGPDVTLDQITADGLALSDYLRERLGKTKIILMGVNFGSNVGLRMASAQPDRFAAYVGAGQIVACRAAREQFSYERLLRLAQAAGDEAALADLKTSGPHPFQAPRDPARVSAFLRAGSRYRSPHPPAPLQAALSGLDWTVQDVMAAQGAVALNEARLGQAWGRDFDVASLGRHFDVPVFIIQGEDNDVAPTPQARAWLATITAPAKLMVTIPVAGNHAIETHTAEFLGQLNHHVRPLAVTAP